MNMGINELRRELTATREELQEAISKIAALQDDVIDMLLEKRTFIKEKMGHVETQIKLANLEKENKKLKSVRRKKTSSGNGSVLKVLKGGVR